MTLEEAIKRAEEAERANAWLRSSYWHQAKTLKWESDRRWALTYMVRECPNCAPKLEALMDKPEEE